MTGPRLACAVAAALLALLFVPPAAGAPACGPGSRGWVEQTDATYYHPSLRGDLMANGRPYDPGDPGIAASNRYPLGTSLRITNLSDPARAAIVAVQDRGSRTLTLDLSEAGFQRLAPLAVGRIPVCVEIW